MFAGSLARASSRTPEVTNAGLVLLLVLLLFLAAYPMAMLPRPRVRAREQQHGHAQACDARAARVVRQGGRAALQVGGGPRRAPQASRARKRPGGAVALLDISYEPSLSWTTVRAASSASISASV